MKGIGASTPPPPQESRLMIPTWKLSSSSYIEIRRELQVLG